MPSQICSLHTNYLLPFLGKQYIVSKNQNHISTSILSQVASSPIKNENDEDDINQRLDNNQNEDTNYKPCLDPESKATLYPLDNFDWNGSDLTQRPLNLRTEARRLSSGRFTRNSVSYQSIEIKGRCCWEAFSRPGFRGRKLRLCRGKFNSNILGSLSNNILSIRPVEHFT